MAQAPKDSEKPAGPATKLSPWQRVLKGEDAKKVEALEQQIAELENKGRFPEAIAPAREALAIRRRVQGWEHWEVVLARIEEQTCVRVSGLAREAQADLATTIQQSAAAASLGQKGRYAEAQHLYERALAIRRRVLGDDHPHTAHSYQDLATNLDAQERYGEAQPLHERALAIARQALGEGHPYTAAIYNNVASNLDERGRSGEAQPLHERALAIWRQSLGEDHPDTAGGYNNLAHCLSAQGHYAEAKPLYERALAICRKAFGEDHPRTATSYTNLAGILHQQGKYTEAQALYRKALTIWRRALGEDHPSTAQGYNNLAFELNAQGKHGEAETVYHQALAIKLRVRGNDHPDTAISYNNLAVTLDYQGKFAEAELLSRKAVAIWRRWLGEDHPNTASGYGNLAFCLYSQGKYAEAEPLYQKALAIRRQKLGEDHPLTLLSLGNLANNLTGQGRFTEAELLYQKALAIQSRIMGANHTDQASTHHNRAGNFRDQGKYAEAEPLYRKALDIDRRALGADHPRTAVHGAALAFDLSAQGKYVEAEPLDREALDIDRRALGEDHPHTAFTYDNLALNLNAQGRYAEAEAMALAAVKSFEAARLRVSFTGLDRASFATLVSPLSHLASFRARRGQDRDAWQQWEASLARGLFDDLEARRNRPLTTFERQRQEDLIGQLNRLDNQVAALTSAQEMPEDRRQRLDDVKNQRLFLQGQLVQLEATLVQKYKAAVGTVYDLDRIQSHLPADAALVGWLDLKTQPAAADSKGDHWACVVRRTGMPMWVRMVGTGPDGAWTKADEDRPGQIRKMVSNRPSSAWQDSLGELAKQRLGPLEFALRARGELPAVQHLIVLPSPAMAGIPVEPLLEARPKNLRPPLVSYAPSATLFAWLQERRREHPDKPVQPRRLLALGDPVPPPTDQPTEAAPKPPDHGLLVRVVQPGSNAAQASIQPGDVLLRYAGTKLANRDDLQKQVQATNPKAAGVAVVVWREGKIIDLTLKPGPLGVQLETRPAAEVILAQRESDALLRRSRGSAFSRLPGTRREVQAIAALFDQKEVFLGSDASEQLLDDLRTHDKLSQFSVLHLAAHGKMDDLIPMNSRLLLSQDRLSDPSAATALDQPYSDGAVTAGEVLSTWKLNAELVTLSACQSGLGRQSGGEGFVGFAQAFFLAGGRSLVLSLWEVNDRATSLLMTRFYENWLGKREGLAQPLSKAEALREAKAWLRGLTSQQVDGELDRITRGQIVTDTAQPVATCPFAHPHYWAGFILMGDPS
jgi:tetratricopeptide (TPR) repeat protein